MCFVTSKVCVCFCLFVIADLQRILCATENTGITCKLPLHPKNGRWTILNGSGRPGDQISKDSVVKFECDEGYRLSSHIPFLICDDKWDVSKVSTCEKKCSPKYSTSTTIIKCEDKYGMVVGCDEAVDGTYLTYSCIPYYEIPLGYKKTILCIEGMWNFPNPVCQPVCGKKIDKDTLMLIIGGEIKQKREFPWIAAVFQKLNTEFENVCGGSLVSQRVVITAAHCVTNTYGDTLPPENFIVGLGKYYNKFQDSRDVNAQYVEVARVITKSGYKGEIQRFIADIALLIVKDLIAFNEVIQPVCYQDLPTIHLQPGRNGIVAGWGRTEKGEQSDVLRTLEIPYKHETTCAQELPSQWSDKFFTIDKICAGFVNKSKSVCTGDSGSGLYFQNPEDSRYYIHGIVSVAPAKNGECDDQQNTLYTSVAYYYELVDREITRQYVQQCPLPSHPENGRWNVPNQNKKPMDVVPSNTVLKVECNQGYALSSNSAFIDCKSAAEIPKCELLCPTLHFPEQTIYNCKNKIGGQIECTKAAEGSSLYYSCPEGYKLPPGSSNMSFCNMGSWGHHKPECIVDLNQDFAFEKKKIVCTYASWYAHVGVLPEHFNETLCTHFMYAYIGIGENGELRVQNGSLELDNNNHRGLYRRVTDLKFKNKDLKVLLSIGGPSVTNTLFSSMAINENKKAAFIDSTIYYIEHYNFDGVDIAWNYPKNNDKIAYISLLREVKKKYDERRWLLTATVRSDPEGTGYDGKEMNQILDWVNVNTYDFYGPWSNYTGHISLLYPSSTESSWQKDHLNIEAAARNWIVFGVTKSKMILTIVFYGWSLTLLDKNVNGLHAPIKWTSVEDYKLLRYSEICTIKDGTSVWDNEQKSVYRYNDDQWIGHENNNSVWIKTDFIRNNGFLGVNVWPVDGDDIQGKCGPKQILLKNINKGPNGNS